MDNWAQHDQPVVIDAHAADNYIRMIDVWKSQRDQNDVMVAGLAHQHCGYTYRILPTSPRVRIAPEATSKIKTGSI